MNRHTRTLTAPMIRMVPLALLAVSIVGYQAIAQRAVAPAPPVVATVQMEPLFDGLQERAEAKAEVAALDSKLQSDLTARRAAIQTLQEELENVVAAARRQELVDQIALAHMKLQLWQQNAMVELEIEKALRLQHLYSSIKTSIKELAEDEGYDMVMLNDSADELPFDREARIPVQMQVLQQITNRKILYLNSALDITEDLVIRMNNEFRAAQAGP